MNKVEQAIDPNTRPEVLELLATDEDPLVRFDVASNPNTPPKTLELLTSDKNYYIRKEASQKQFLIMMRKCIR